MDRFKFKQVLKSVLGVFFLLLGIGYLSKSQIISSLSFISAGVLTIQQLFDKVNQISSNKITRNVRIVLIIMLFFSGLMFTSSDGTEVDSVNKSVEAQPVDDKSEVINENVDIENTQEKVSVVSVSDGDTIRVKIADDEVTLRLIGINTPEINHQSEPVQCYGPEAKKALENLILNKEVVLEKDVSDKDQYDRLLRYIWIGEVLVNEKMTQDGFAMASAYPPDIKYQERINAGQENAKSLSIGFWSYDTCKGEVYTGTYKDPNKAVEEEIVIKDEVVPEVIKPAIVAPVVIPQPKPKAENISKYTCDCSKACGKMSSCEEAYFQLNQCGCSVRDGDDDGVPCEDICR